ncbi:MAG: hypothetical protein HW416_1351 [Chloroflexi bacterium]|nr:hypothetical protein [Chloroflexota bacterium]
MQGGGPIIVCGLGQVGYRVVSLLCKLGEPAAAIGLASRDEWVRSVREQGVLFISGDARDPALLDAAGLSEARAIIAATDQDLVNLEIALDAKARRPDLPVVLRVFDQMLARQLEASLGMRRAAGMSALAAPMFAAAAMGEQAIACIVADDCHFMVGRLRVGDGTTSGLSIGDLAARHRLATIVHEPVGSDPVLMPHQSAALRDGDGLIVVGQADDWAAAVARQHPTLGQRMWAQQVHPERRLLGGVEAAFRAWRNLPFALRAIFATLLGLIAFSVVVFSTLMNLSLVDAFYYVVSTVTTTGYGDITPRDAPLKLYAALLMILGSLTLATMYSIITDLVVTARVGQLLGRRTVPEGGHVVVAGIGNVGYRTVEELRSHASVVAVERSPDAEFVNALRGRLPLVLGDARQESTLAQANMAGARAIVAATGDDATNLAIGLSARRLNGQAQIVVRMFEAEFASKVQQSFAFDAVLSASMTSAPTFVAAALYPGVLAAFVLSGQLIVFRQSTVGDEDSGRRPSELRASEGASVIFRMGKNDVAFVVAGGDDPLTKGDQIITLVWRPILA